MVPLSLLVDQFSGCVAPTCFLRAVLLYFRSLSLFVLFSPAASLENAQKTRDRDLSRETKTKFRNDEHQRPRQDLRAEALARRDDRAKIMDQRQQVS